MATAALLVLSLAITTGWTSAGPATDRGVRSGAAAAAAPLRTVSTERHFDRLRSAWIAADLSAHRASETSLASSARALHQARVIAAQPAPAPVRAKAVKAPAVKAPAKAAAKTYSGTNHFWFPALGISRSVVLFPCARQRPPDHYLYRWGCAGTNNVYVMGHASSVFKALHDAYNAGRLRIGMIAKYADGNGRVRTYRITAWRVVDPVDSHWAIASQPVPSMTLQTCVGPNGVDRLNVRLVIVR